MSRLELASRPWAEFDATDKEHRKWYAQFARERSWGKIPVRFILPEDASDLVSMCQEKLVDYYSKREFERISG